MKLSQEQIQELHKFTRAHFVEYYDLQTELVDHLANGIEEQYNKQPSLTFKEALNREFKKFGVFGFQEVVKKRKDAMSKKYRKILWNYFKDWGSFPKPFLTLSTIAILFIAIKNLPNGDFKFGIICGVFLAITLMFFYRFSVLRRRMQGVQRIWMLEEMIFNQGLALQLFILPINFLNLSNTNTILESDMGQLGIATLMIVVILLFKVCGFVIPSKAEELLSKTYPEYKMG